MKVITIPTSKPDVQITVTDMQAHFLRTLLSDNMRSSRYNSVAREFFEGLFERIMECQE